MTHRPVLLSTVCLLCLAVPAAAQTAGVTAAVNQSATGLPPGGAVRTVVLGDNVVRNERIDTNGIGLVQILLADGTAFTVGPDSSITIDDFVYNPEAGTAKVAASMTRGVLRFIGGRTSKTENGVSLATPVGTVGIRGAVADITLAGASSGTGTPTHIDLVFGQEVTLSGGGGAPARVYRPGYSIVVDGDGRRSVRKTPPEYASLVQSALAGRPGTSGGTSRPPTDRLVADSPVGPENSERALVLNAPPLPTPRPPDPNDADATLVADATFDLVRLRVAYGLTPVDQPPAPPPTTEPQPPEPQPPVEQPPAEPPVVLPPVVEPPVVEPEPPVVPEPPTEPEPPVEPEPETVPLNVYRSLDDGSGAILGAILGAPTATEATVTSDGRLVGTLGPEGAGFDLPAFEDAEPVPGDSSGRAPLNQRSVGSDANEEVPADDTASYDGDPLTGTVYVGSEGFRAYLLRNQTSDGSTGPSSDQARFQAIAGTGTPTPVFGTSAIYSYRIDRTEGFALFAAPANVLADASNAYVIGDASSPRFFQSDLSIQQSSGGQSSAVTVNVGGLSIVSGSYVLDGFNAGGTRTSGEDRTSESGSFETLTNTQGQGFFGTSGDYAVLSGTPGTPSPFTSASSDASATSTAFNQTRVLARDAAPIAVPAERYAGTYTGFAAGLVEARQTFSDGAFSGPGTLTPRRTRDPSQTSLTFSGTSVTGGITFSSDGGSPVPPVSILVGQDGRSAFVDDARFAAVDARGSYMLSGRAVPVSFPSDGSYNGGTFELCTQCEFIQWGWWGTQTDVPVGSPSQDTTRSGVHLGQWVTGPILADVPTTAGVSATYSGNALATVNNGGAVSIQPGRFTMGWDFGARSGNATIGISGVGTASTGLSDPAVSGGGTSGRFAGSSLSPTSAGTLSISGAFVNNGALPTGSIPGGVIGNFDILGGPVTATGIFGGTPAPL